MPLMTSRLLMLGEDVEEPAVATAGQDGAADAAVEPQGRDPGQGGHPRGAAQRQDQEH